MAQTVFLIDPKLDTETPLPGFAQLGMSRRNWLVTRLQHFHPGMDGITWLRDFEDQLRAAQIIVGLGNFLPFYQAGESMEPFLEIVCEKFEQGCPILLDGCQALVGGHFPQIDRKFDTVLRRFGIGLTGIKVASHIQEYSKHSSDLCCAFHAADDSLLDPRLFDDIDTVWSYGNRLIQYEPGVFPLIETGQLHFFADEGDLLSRGNLGQKNAIAVRHMQRGKYLAAFTGRFFSDPSPTLGGITPGLEDNFRFAEHVIDEISLHASSRVLTTSTAFEVMAELERSLGRLIECVLCQVGQSSDFSSLLPDEIRKKLVEGSGQLDYSRATFNQLIVILKEQWQHFAIFFRTASGQAIDRIDVIRPLFEINEGPRRYLAHPHKAAQRHWSIDSKDMKAIERSLEQIRHALEAATRTADYAASPCPEEGTTADKVVLWAILGAFFTRTGSRPEGPVIMASVTMKKRKNLSTI